MQKDLTAIIDAMPGKAVLVVGDIMLDRFIFGDAERIAPEAPVPVVRARKRQDMPGGAGNVLANLCGLGLRPRLVALRGEDEAGSCLQALIGDLGCDTDGLLVADDGRPTTLKTRIMADRHLIVRLDDELSTPVDTNTEDRLVDAACARLDGCGALILSDYGKGVLTPAVVARLIAEAGRRGIPVLVDPKGSDYSLYKGASVVTPNRKELAQATGMPVADDDDIIRAAQALRAQSGIESVVATRSQDGMSIFDKDADPVHLRATALEVFDVSGAGDTVIATIAAALAGGAALVQAATIANEAAGIVVARTGTVAVSHDALRARMTAVHPGDTALRSRTQAQQQIKQWQAQGLKVGFTNGCFDIIHRGHAGYLAQARSRCDRLVVGLNADQSVRRLKGESRPVNDEQARAAVIGALAAVDMVILFGDRPEDDDKPVALIEALRPDIFFKGGDYRESDLPEATTVRAYGGEVCLMGLFEGHSTTGIINKVQTG